MKGHTGFVVTLLAAGLHSAVAGLPYQIDNDAHKSEPKLPGVYRTRTHHWGHGTAGPTIGYPGTAPPAGPTAVPGKPYPAWPHYPPSDEGEPGHQPSYPHVPATGGWDKGGEDHEGEGGQHDGWGNGGNDHDSWGGSGGDGGGEDHKDDECQDDGIPLPPPHPSKPHPKPTGAYPTMPVGTGGPHVPPIGDKPPQYATTLSTVSRGYGKPVQPTAPVMTAYN